MAKRAPMRQAPRSDCVIPNGTWVEELPPEVELRDRPVLVTVELEGADE